jgi:hypothetical protein
MASLALWPWVEVARRHDLPIDRLATLASVEVAELRDPGVRFSQVVANRIAEIVIQRAGAAAAMLAAQAVEAGQFALLEIAARTAPNVGHALAQVCRFFPLVHEDVRFVHEILSSGEHVVRVVMPPAYPIHPAYIEYAFGCWVLALRRETEQPSVSPREVWFKHRAGGDREPFETVFGPGVKFEMPEHRMLLAQALVELPLCRSNSEVHRAAVQAATDLVHSREQT